MQLGIFARTFPGGDVGAVLRATASAGFAAAQFNLACAGLPSMPDDVPTPVIDSVRAAMADTGVELVALSGTYNMIHPDPAARAQGLARLCVVLQAARVLRIPLVTLCTGTRDPLDQWRHHPDNARPDAWSDLCHEMTLALDMAETEGVDLGIEPEQANAVTSASDARRLISEMGSARLRVVLDPANLFEQGHPAEVRMIVADAVEHLGDRIAMAHAKDRCADGGIAPAGTGIVDFPDFVARLRQSGFRGPLVTHGLSPEQAPGVATFLRGLLA